MTTTQAALLEAPDDAELDAWRATADDLLRCNSDNSGLTRKAAFLLQNAYLFGTKAGAALRAADAAQPEPVAYLARSRYGSQCHFGMKAAADAWAGDGGEVFEIPLRHLGLVSPSLAQPAPIAAQAEPMTERDYLDFGLWLTKLGDLADAYYEAGRTAPARRRARADLMLHACDAATGWRARSVLAAQAGPALVPLTRQQIDEVMTEHYPLSSLLREEVDAFEACVRDIERAHGIGAQAPQSTRPADASISRQRVDMAPHGWKLVPVEPTHEMLKAAEACGYSSCGHTWSRGYAADEFRAMLAAAPQAPAEQPLRWCNSCGEGVQTFCRGKGGVVCPMFPAAPVAPAEPAAQAVALPAHEVWREGYRITGESEGAVKLGEAQADTFEEACDIVCRGKADYDAKTRRVWGCRLFNNEADARKAFG